MKRLAILLILSLMLSFLFSCSSSDDKKEDNTDGGSEVGGEGGGEEGGEEEKEQEKEEEKEEPEEEIDVSGAIDLTSSDISEFLSFPEEKYKNFDLSLNIAKPRKKNPDGSGVSDVEAQILNLLASRRTLTGDGKAVENGVIGAGDAAYIWYRGYLIDEVSGEKVIVDGMCNFSSSTPSQLVIGSGQFVPGFEADLVGTDLSGFARFEKIEEGSLSAIADVADAVIYVSYKRLADGADTEKTATASYLRIDLSDPELDSLYGEGFENIISEYVIKESNSFDAVIDGVTYNYTDFVINFATICEKTETNGDMPINVVECYFPYNYGHETLSNQTAYFEVYVHSMIDYTVPEADDEFVRALITEDILGITEAELTEYEGDTLYECLESFIDHILTENYNNSLKSLVESEIWNYYLKTATVTKYPEGNVNVIYKQYLDDVKYQYEQNGGYYYHEYFGVIKCDSLDEYAQLYLGLSSEADWRKSLKSMAESLVKERLILYYIMGKENLFPEEAELTEKIDALKKEHLDEYIKEYLEHIDKTESDYTPEEFEKFSEERAKELFAYYSDEFFKESVLYQIGYETISTYANVKTLDDK